MGRRTTRSTRCSNPFCAKSSRASNQGPLCCSVVSLLCKTTCHQGGQCKNHCPQLRCHTVGTWYFLCFGPIPPLCHCITKPLLDPPDSWVFNITPMHLLQSGHLFLVWALRSKIACQTFTQEINLINLRLQQAHPLPWLPTSRTSHCSYCDQPCSPRFVPHMGGRLTRVGLQVQILLPTTG